DTANGATQMTRRNEHKIQPDAKAASFLQHLRVERNASVYTLRNYEQTLREVCQGHQHERQVAPIWNALTRDDFRAYLRILGRKQMSRAAILLRFSALRSFYKFLARKGDASGSPI